MEVLKHCISEKDFLRIEMTFDICFPWIYQNSINRANDGYFQFIHRFYNQRTGPSNFFGALKPILDVLKPKTLFRVKANLLTKTDQIVEHGYHIDFIGKDCTTAILYVNTNNGYTKFENGTKIESERNKLVKFNSNMKHTGSSCTNKNYRIVVNFNYE